MDCSMKGWTFIRVSAAVDREAQMGIVDWGREAGT